MQRLWFMLCLTVACVVPTEPAPHENLIVGGVPSEAQWSAYVGGVNEDQFRDVAVDAQGNSIMVGGSASPDYPTTAGTAQPVHSAGNGQGGAINMDVIVTKVDPRGQLVWSTFIGGPGYDRAYAVEVDAQGEIVVAGRAAAGFPTTAATVQPTFGGGGVYDPKYGPQDGFVCKLTSAGKKVWCTYFGGDEKNIIRDVDVDAAGNVFLATSTSLTSWPATWFTNAYQKTKKGGADDLLVKLSSDGSRVVWATFLGGSKDETRTPSVRVTATGVWFLTTTLGTDLPVVGGRPNAGGADYWVGQFSLNGRQLRHSTYVGGSGSEGIETHNLAVDGNRVYIAAGTGSTTFPLSVGSFGGTHDGMLVALDTTARELSARYVSTPGPDGLEGVNATATEVCAAGFVSGALAGVPLWGTGGGKDAVLLCFDRDLRQSIYGIRLGGSGEDYARSIAVAVDGSLIGAAHSNSTNWPVLNSALGGFHGVYDAVAARFRP